MPEVEEAVLAQQVQTQYLQLILQIQLRLGMEVMGLRTISLEFPGVLQQVGVGGCSKFWLAVGVYVTWVTTLGYYLVVWGATVPQRGPMVLKAQGQAEAEAD